MTRIALLLVLVAAALTGCAARPTPAQLAAADCGPPPGNYQEIVKKHLHKSFYDPYSAVYENWRGPAKSYNSNIAGVTYGYRVCVDINAKNRLGGYVGSKTCTFLIRYGAVNSYLCGGENIFINANIEQSCQF